MKLKNDYIDAMKNKDINMMKKLEDEYEVYQLNVKEKALDKQVITDGITDHFHLLKMQVQNRQQRERIVEALGGKHFCETIPIIEIKNFDEYLYFNTNDIPKGFNMAQYEDNACRKGMLLKLKNKNTRDFEVVWIFQRYRETSISGNLWMANGAITLEGSDKIISFINQIKPIPHETYELALLI